MEADKSFKFSETELKGIVNNVYFGGVSDIGQPMVVTRQSTTRACTEAQIRAGSRCNKKATFESGFLEQT